MVAGDRGGAVGGLPGRVPVPAVDRLVGFRWFSSVFLGGSPSVPGDGKCSDLLFRIC